MIVLCGEFAILAAHMMPFQPQRDREALPRWYNAGLWVLLFMGVLVRIADLQLMEFKGDEFHFLTESFRNPFALASIHAIRSSVPVPHPPAFAYVLALPVSFTIDPIAIVAVIVFLNLLGLWGLYFLCQRVFDRSIALVTTTLVASLPWAVVFSRKIWNPDIVFPSTVLLLIALVFLLESYNSNRLLYFTAALALFSQTHLLCLLTVPVFLVIALTAGLPIERRDAVKASLMFFFLHLPYLAYIFSAGMPAVAGFTGNQLDHGIQLQFFHSNLFWWLRTGSGLGFQFLLGDHGYEELLRTYALSWVEIVFRFYLFAAILGACWCGGRALHIITEREQGHSGVQARLLCTLIGAAVYLAMLLTAAHIDGFPHYWVMVIPLLPLCFAIFARYGERFLLPQWLWIPRAGVLLIAATHVAFMIAFFAFVAHHPDRIDGDYGESYVSTRQFWQHNLERIAGEVSGAAH